MTMTEPEKQYFREAHRHQTGVCDVCHRARGDDGKLLHVARNRAHRYWRCFDCRGK
jgi:hypothetical protein